MPAAGERLSHLSSPPQETVRIIHHFPVSTSTSHTPEFSICLGVYRAFCPSSQPRRYSSPLLKKAPRSFFFGFFFVYILAKFHFLNPSPSNTPRSRNGVSSLFSAYFFQQKTTNKKNTTQKKTHTNKKPQKKKKTPTPQQKNNPNKKPFFFPLKTDLVLYRLPSPLPI